MSEITERTPEQGEVAPVACGDEPAAVVPTATPRSRYDRSIVEGPLHAAVWATKLCDITGMDNRVLYDRAVSNAHDWYRNKFEANLAWDRLVEQVLTATAADICAERKLSKVDTDVVEHGFWRHGGGTVDA